MKDITAASTAFPKPPWLRVVLPQGETFRAIRDTLDGMQLHTVCEEAHCPNLGECWGGGTATFMILGDVCTRGCRFCAVKTGRSGTSIDPMEPEKIAEAIIKMQLEYVVITSVDRDDLIDQGAVHFAKVVECVKQRAGILVEVLIPDFKGNEECLKIIANSGPDVIAHNIETVRSLTPVVRDRKAGYDQSLEVLAFVKSLRPDVFTKSSIMLGIGETKEELKQAFYDLRQHGVDFLTLGQYLRPTPKHLEVNCYVTPEEFDNYANIARSQGFGYVASGPLVRSSYRAGEFFVKSLVKEL